MGTYMLGYLLVIVAMVFMMVTQSKIRSAYRKYTKISNHLSVTGAQVAREILDSNGLYDVAVRPVKGQLTDHYHPIQKVVNLSEGNYNGNSIAAISIAAHECGHAIQHQQNYQPMKMRGIIVPFANVGNYLGWAAIMIGFLTGSSSLAWIGVILLFGILAFQLVTLPVEFDASARALSILEARYLSNDEMDGARSMLNAAALTYVAAAFATAMSILRYVLILSGSSRD